MLLSHAESLLGDSDYCVARGWSGPGPGGRTIDLDESASLSLSVFNLKLPVVPAGGSRLGCDSEIWTIA